MNMISLYNFLKKPAGKQLGLEVGLEAYRQNIPVVVTSITTKHYSGKINLYPKEFLQDYFKQRSVCQSR